MRGKPGKVCGRRESRNVGPQRQLIISSSWELPRFFDRHPHPSTNVHRLPTMHCSPWETPSSAVNHLAYHCSHAPGPTMKCMLHPAGPREHSSVRKISSDGRPTSLLALPHRPDHWYQLRTPTATWWDASLPSYLRFCLPAEQMCTWVGDAHGSTALQRTPHALQPLERKSSAARAVLCNKVGY